MAAKRRKVLRQFLVASAFGVAALAAVKNAQAADKCARPPYGASRDEYLVYRDTMGSVIPASHLLPSICRAKFEGGSRSSLHLLGITDGEIARLSVADLAVRVIGAIRARINAEERREPPSPQGIYIAFTCSQSGGCRPPGPAARVFHSRAGCERFVRTIGLADDSRPVYMRCFFHAYPWQP